VGGVGGGGGGGGGGDTIDGVGSKVFWRLRDGWHHSPSSLPQAVSRRHVTPPEEPLHHQAEERPYHLRGKLHFPFPPTFCLAFSPNPVMMLRLPWPLLAVCGCLRLCLYACFLCVYGSIFVGPSCTVRQSCGTTPSLLCYSHPCPLSFPPHVPLAHTSPSPSPAVPSCTFSTTQSRATPWLPTASRWDRPRTFLPARAAYLPAFSRRACGERGGRMLNARVCVWIYERSVVHLLVCLYFLFGGAYTLNCASAWGLLLTLAWRPLHSLPSARAEHDPLAAHEALPAARS